MISKRLLLMLSLLVALGLTSLPSMASAQGRGNGNGGRADVENRRERDRNNDRDDDRYYDERYDRQSDRGGEGPPFCRNGQGHPVHGWEWCEDKGYGRHDNRSLGDIIFGDNRNVSGSRNYDRSHEQFHYELDRRYSELASRRPLDLEYQVRIRREKAAEHDRWHQQAGIRH